MATDAELISAWRSGDDQALETLLRRHASGIHGYLVRLLGNPFDAEDAAQEALIRAVRGLPRYRERGQFRSWLYRIAHREGLRTIRRRRRYRQPPVEPGAGRTVEAVDTAPHPAEELAGREEVARLAEAVNRLPPREKAVVLMRTELGLTFREIARAMHCPLNTALGRMHSARGRLRMWLGE